MIKVSRGCCGDEELAEVKEAFDYGYFGLAYKVEEFENSIKDYLQTDRCVVATNTGTTALHLALSVIGVKQGDEVILPSFTFVATAQAITACGATPIFCEIDKDSLLMDISDVKSKITNRTKAIIPVHYAGDSCNMDALMKIHDETGIRIIEDAAHAIGTSYKGKRIGSFGDITCFSFDSIKVMTCGEGGAVLFNNQDDYTLAKKQRLLGIDREKMVTKDWKKRAWIYDVPTKGYRYHMSNINAAIGLAQIKKLDKFIQRRREICKQYDSLLENQQKVELIPRTWDEISPFMYVVKISDGLRNNLKAFLMENDIETGISYIPCHRFSLYADDTNNLPKTDDVFESILCLPIHYELSDENIKYICEKIHKFLG